MFPKKEQMFHWKNEVKAVYGEEGLLEIARYHRYENEWLVNALVGVSGLHPTVLAIQNKKILLLPIKKHWLSAAILFVLWFKSIK